MKRFDRSRYTLRLKVVVEKGLKFPLLYEVDEVCRVLVLVPTYFRQGRVG